MGGQNHVGQERDRQLRDARDSQQKDHLGEPMLAGAPPTQDTVQSLAQARQSGRHRARSANGDAQR